MEIKDIMAKVPEKAYSIISKNIQMFRPGQEKAINAGLLEGESLLICTPTASGKTLIAELAITKKIIEQGGKAIYIVPLKALASEKYREFKKKYGSFLKVAISIGDFDSSDSYLADYDLIFTTSEKLDSLLRHSVPWISHVNTLIVDEIHLLNDASRGPTLEVLLTMLRMTLRKVQILGLSATIGNPQELADWLDAKLVMDTWRPVKLEQGVYFDGEVEFVNE